MQIVPAQLQDTDTLTQIAIRAKRHWGYPDSWIESWRQELTIRPEHILQHEVQLALLDGLIVGFYTLAAEGHRVCLADLFVLPEEMGKGIGRQLFAHALNRAKEQGFALLTIESDPNAEGFYVRMVLAA